VFCFFLLWGGGIFVGEACRRFGGGGGFIRRPEFLRL